MTDVHAGAPLPRSRRSAVDLLPFAAFGVLFVATLNQWYVPFADSAREVSVASRLADGEVLYRDVPYWYGPLPPHLDAWALRLFGKHLGVLVSLRVLFALAGIEALRRLVGRVTPDALLRSGITTAVVTACFFLPNGASVAFPYSAAVLEGTVGCWIALAAATASTSPRTSLLAAAVGGFAAGTKLELAPAGLLAVAIPLFARRPRREAAAATALAAGLAAAALGLPAALVGQEVLMRRGFLVAFAMPGAYRRFFSDLFWGGSREDFLSRTATSWALSAAFLAFGAVVIRLAGRRGAWGLVGCYAAGLVAAAIPSNREIQILVPGYFVLLGATLLALRRTVDARIGADRPAMAGLGLVSLPLAVRQPFGLVVGSPYSGFTGPGALAFSLLALSGRLAAPAAAGSFLLGLSTAQVADRIREHRAGPRDVVSTGRGTLSLYACEARVVGGLVEWLRKTTPPGSQVAGIPKPGLVLFLADRRSPFTEEEWGPIPVDEPSSAQAVDALLHAPIAAGFYVNRPYLEFGYGLYGDAFGREILSALEERMRPVGRIGGADGRCPPGALVDTAILYAPRDGPKPARAGDAPP